MSWRAGATLFLVTGVVIGGALVLLPPKVTIHPLPSPNPISYVFHSSKTKVYEALTRAAAHWQQQGLHFILYADGAYSQNFHDPIGKSSVYFANGKPLDYLAEFRIHLAGLSTEQTRVDIVTSETEVIAGQSFGVGSCGPGMANRYVPVKATTVEEYRLLLDIGKEIGEKGMPSLQVPGS